MTHPALYSEDVVLKSRISKFFQIAKFNPLNLVSLQNIVSWCGSFTPAENSLELIRELEQLCPGDIIVSFSSMNTGFEHIIPLFAKIRNFKTSYPTPNLLGYKYDDPIYLYFFDPFKWIKN